MNKLFFLLLFCFIPYAYGQSLHVFDVDPSEFPKVKAKFYAYDGNWKRLSNLDINSFEITEDGMKRVVTNVDCPVPKEPEKLSIVITIDASGSMGNGNLDNAKAAAIALVDMLPPNNTEIALTKFNSQNAIIQDFTSDKNRLKDKIKSLTADNGTDFDAGYISQMSGSLLIAEKGKNKKVVIFITDGFATGSEKAIIDKANQINANLFNIIVGGPAPQILRNISEKTGGKCYEDIVNSNDLHNIFLEIYNRTANSAYCTIEWLSEISCNDINSYNIFLVPFGLSSNGFYYTGISYKKKLVTIPNRIEFFDCIPGETYTKDVLISAENGDIIISEIKVNNSNFVFIGDIRGKILKAGESTIITVKYNCIDYSSQIALLDIISSACFRTVLYAFGVEEKDDNNYNLEIKVTHPNGIEKFNIKSDTVIKWEYEDPTFPITLDFSPDRGASWMNLTNNALNGTFNWKNLPDTPSENCLIKATAVEKHEDNSFRDIYFSPSQIECLKYNSDGTKLAIGCAFNGLAIYNTIDSICELVIKFSEYNTSSLSFSPTGRYVAICGKQKITRISGIFIWDDIKKKLLKCIPNSNYRFLKFSNDEKYIYGIENGKNSITRFEMDSNDIQGTTLFNGCELFDISKQGLIAISYGGYIKIYNLKSGFEVLDCSKIIPNFSYPSTIEFSEDGKYLALCNFDRALVLDLDAQKVAIVIPIIGSNITNNSVELCSDAKGIAVYHSDNKIRYYTFPSGNLINTFTTIGSKNYFDISPDSKCFSFTDKEFKIVNLNSGNSEKTIKKFGNIMGICSMGNYVITNNLNNINYLDLNNMKIKWVIDNSNQNINLDPDSYDISDDCSKIALGLDSIYIIDANTGKKIQNFHFNGYIPASSIQFSFDNKNLFIGSNNSIYYYSIDKNDTLNSYSFQSKIVSMIASPEINLVLIVTSKNELILFDYDKNKEIFKIVCEDNISKAEFSYDGNIIAVGSNGKYIRLYETTFGNLLMEVKQNVMGQRISLIGFSPDGYKIAWLIHDTIVVYDAFYLNLISKKCIHSYVNNGFWYGNDEIVFHSGDVSISKTFVFDYKILASDVSDTTFSIVCPELTYKAKENIGDLLYGTRKDIIINDFFVNNDAFPITVQWLTVTDPTVTLLAPALPFTLLPGEKKNLEFYVIPDKYDSATVEINFATECRQLQSKLSYYSVPPEIQVLTNYLDFGELWVGDTKTLNKALIKNVSNRDIEITKINLAGPDLKQFAFIEPANPIIIRANSELPLDMTFSPKYYGRTCSDIAFEYKGAGSPVKSQLFGEGIGETVYIAPDSAYANDRLDLKLMTTGGRPESMQAIITKFFARLRFQKSILAALPNENVSFSISGDSNIVEISGDITTGSNMIYPLKVIAGLGDVTTTPVEILDYKWLGSNGETLDYDTKFENGSFKLLGVCPEGGERLIKPDGAVEMKIFPVPAKELLDIELSLIETGRTDIAVYNTLGEKLKTLFCEEITNPGFRKLVADLSSLNTGQYILVLSTPTVVKSLSIIKAE